MSRVYGIHMLELKPGVTPEEFESFATGAGEAFLKAAGGKTHILRGDRGARTGKYVALVEFDSVEARNKAFPTVDVPPEEAPIAQSEPVHELLEKWVSLASGLGDPDEYTDYIVVNG